MVRGRPTNGSELCFRDSSQFQSQLAVYHKPDDSYVPPALNPSSIKRLGAEIESRLQRVVETISQDDHGHADHSLDRVGIEALDSVSVVSKPTRPIHPQGPSNNSSMQTRITRKLRRFMELGEFSKATSLLINCRKRLPANAVELLRSKHFPASSRCS